ncbi:PHB depolymerase family esterase [Telmatospirillum sp. J64-1]|uniref:extracellular catalytic domain type 1 short-chain-length polyhydroxyalkanoate depolymerase n=1 Tax=Telmatospirillum sp. J64-1 TaxID=2502183 RepID=UPI00115E9665|nr:PHB depolymerase family esterase [Telmatospirillum sp. J64-1]
MNHHDMEEATRLTRAGRLAEATALIQRLLSGHKPDAAPDHEPAGSYTVIEGEARRVEESGTEEAPFSRSSMKEALHGLKARFAPKGAGQWAERFSQPKPIHAPPPPDGASFVTKTYSSAAGTREYKLYTPAGRAGQRLPLVVMLHGCTQSPDDFAAGTGMNELAEEQGFFVAYPAQPPSANPSKCWNWFDPQNQGRDKGEAALIAGLTRQIMKDHAVDPSRIYIAGLSAGGAAAAIMGATYPDLYAAIGVHSGLACGAARDIPSAFTAMRMGGAPALSGSGKTVPTIVFHGDQDNTVHLRNGEHIVAQAKTANPQAETTMLRGQVSGGHAYSRILHTAPSGQVICEQWTIHGAGHAWSGGKTAGSYTDPKGPDATREMLRFFMEHRTMGKPVS